ncbi:LytTR family DNA-binding domain-containing protein [Asticcacaulis solisilvae]|uniref:LytTR family DNA-binding domain-containing protein n=1 Tax=Asticcacaulis solisilvae TaxID=1217274 RepID=UPI003FD81972
MPFLTFRSAPILPWRALVTLPLAGLILGLIGPFGSYSGMSLFERIGHFMLCATLIGSASLIVSYAVARRFFQGFWPLWAALLVDLALTGPAAAVVYLSLHLIVPGVAARLQPLDFLWQNLILALIFRAVSLLISWARIRDGGQIETSAPSAEAASDLRAKLPRGLRAEPVLALSSEDHYLRVHTPKGEALIHMTLAEAVEGLPHGFQIHRSHWVADTAIRSADANRVELVTGLSLPLSRHRRKAFDAWLDATA